MLYIDFETYSEIDIKLGAYKYSEHESTEVICLAYSFNQSEVKLWIPSNPIPSDLYEYLSSDKPIRSWNINFEFNILNNVCVRKYGFPKIEVSRVYCTMTDALSLNMPSSLDACGEAMGLDIVKDKQGKLLISKLSKPQKPTKKNPLKRLTPKSNPELFLEFYEYCKQDVRSEIAIYNSLPRHISGQELELFRLTLEINQRGMPVDLDLVKSVLLSKEEYLNDLQKKVEEITEGQLDSTNSRPKSLEWLSNQGIVLDGYTKSDIRKALEKDIPEKVREFLNIRNESGRTPIKKFDYLKNAVCLDGTIKDNLIFHKASTGRYASVGFQMQNLPRDSAENYEELIAQFKNNEVKDQVIDKAISLIRNTITSPKGKKLIVSDFSAIENRVLLWCAGDEKGMNDFRNGIDQYKKEASGIYNVPYDEVTKDQRQLGKIAVLSCGYGGGAKTFRIICRDSWGVNLTEEESKNIVDGYRNNNKRVVNLWRGLEQSAIEAVQSKKVCSYRNYKFAFLDDYLFLLLPNKRKLAYYKPEIEMRKTPWGTQKETLTHMGTDTYTKKWKRLILTQGKLTENLVQAVARDFLIEAMLRVEGAGYKIIGTVHDEIITLVDEHFGSADELDRLMSVVPEWGEGCFISAEGYESKRYKK